MTQIPESIAAPLDDEDSGFTASDLLEPIDRQHTLRGAVALLFQTYDSEILIDGPAGTGKTFGVVRYCDYLCRKYPAARILWVRETLQSMRESVQQIYEDHVLWPGHPCLSKGGSRSGRSEYIYPNGAMIVLAGLDTPERLMSTEFDIIVVFEATNPHVREKAWTLLTTRMRGTGIPHPECRYPDGVDEDGTSIRQRMAAGEFPGGEDEDGHPLFFRRAIADCNPDDEMHWLWRRFKAGHMTRLRSLHVDNPTCTNDYLAKLDALPGVWRQRMKEGLWVQAEGAIWSTFSASRHEVDIEFQFEALTGRRFVRVSDWVDDAGNIAEMPLSAVIAGIDWGHSQPGSLQVFGVTSERRCFQLAEYYAAGKGIDWWAERIVEAVDEFHLEVIRCDPSRPDLIEHMNKHLGPRQGREVGGICQPANNKRASSKAGVGDMGGLDAVREAFRKDALFLNRNGLRHFDTTLDAAHLPTRVRMEIGGYVFDRDKDGKLLEIPVKNAIDHGCDAVRYCYMDLFDRNVQRDATVRFTPPEGTVVYHVGTLEERMRMKKLQERTARRRLTW